MLVLNLEQKTQEWLQFRCSHICASDAPVILGQSPYKTIHDLYKEKSGMYKQVTKPWMQRGKDLESKALEVFCDEVGVIMNPIVAKHEEFDWMAASFDGVSLSRDCIVEIKCPGKKDHALAVEGKIPEKYVAQLQHQMCVSGLDFSYYFSFDGEKGIILEVKRDNKFIDKMIKQEITFWRRLQLFTGLARG